MIKTGVISDHMCQLMTANYKVILRGDCVVCWKCNPTVWMFSVM